MNTTLEPMFAMLLGGAEIVLILLSLFGTALVIGAIIFFAIKLSQTRRPEARPAPSVEPPPVAPATQVIQHPCPQCGKPLQPDVPEGLCPACLLQRGIATEGGVPPGTPPFVPPTIPELARLFPQLEIMELIGKGGMGAVYKARQPSLDRFVALKILAPRSGGDLDFAGRFTREARALARLSHPNIVGVYDFGRAELPLGQDAQQRVPTAPVHYFIMEFVDGPNLRQAGKLSPQVALEIIPQICAALQFAHDEGIVHRDIKPENVLLDRKGRVKIADFGLAKILGQEQKDARLTGVRDVMGTPHYMAPEQVERPQDVDHRADIYSLGVVFYEMLTGELPLGKFQTPSQKVQVDVRLDEVVLRSLAKEPDLRYQHVSEMGTRVEVIAGSPPSESESRKAESGKQEVLARDYKLNIRHCLRRGWALVKNDFWPLVGMSAFALVVVSAVSSSGVVWSSHSSSNSGGSSLLGILLAGPMYGGLYFYFLKKIRGQQAGVETAFSGFRQALPHLVIASFLISLLTFLGILCLILPGVYLFIAWTMTFPLVIDRGMDFWPAMQASRKIVSKHWWKFFAFFALGLLINLAGLVCCGVGILITFPITVAAHMFAYEDIIGAVRSRPGAPAAIPPSFPGSPAMPPPDRFWRRFAVVMACVVLIPLAIAIVGMLAAIAIPNFVKARQQAQRVRVESNQRSTAEEIKRRASRTLSFGPVAELNPQVRQSGTNSFLDLDTGNLLTLPPEIANGLSAANPDDADRFWRGLDIVGNSAAARYVAWLQENGVDLMFDEQGEIIAFDGVLAAAHGQSADWDDWDGLSPERAGASLKAIENATRNILSGITSIQPTSGAPADTSAKRLDSRSLKPVVHLLSSEQSDLWYFRTREGCRGILQIISYPDRQTAGKIRYKLVQTKTAPPAKFESASSETWAPTLAPGEKPDLEQIRQDAKQLMEALKYEEALQRHLWYFNHALEYEPSLRGVRLSFMLSDWVELGRHYPKAKQALIEIRDQKTRELAEGRGHSEMFQEVDALNRELQKTDDTYKLFKQLETSDPQLAGQCYLWIEGALVERGEYETCARYLGDPQRRFDINLRSWKQMKGFEERGAARDREQLERYKAMSKTNAGLKFLVDALDRPKAPPYADPHFIDQTRRLIEILVGTDRQAEAEKIRDQAVALLDDARLKSAISDAEQSVAKHVGKE